MFDSIKTALNNTNNGATNSRADILRFTPDNQYDLRFVPNIKDPEKTFFHYYTQSFTSFATGQFISAMSPQTFGNTDLIAQTKFKLKANGTEEEKRKADTIRRTENWLVNVYVVNDPSNPDNNGEVKIMRFGKQLHKIIMDSIQDEDEAAVGFRAFDLSENGCSFRVKVEKQGDFPTYVTSKFLLPSKVPDLEDADAVMEKVYALDEVFNLKSDEDVNKLLDEHFYCGDGRTAGAVPAATTQAPVPEKKRDADLDEEVPMEFPKKEASKAEPADNDDKLEELLAGLDD
tara:strand:+ start:8002 stop:8865 length:864 start_codon:yes stop_codon:yes gene_type:complete